MGSSNGSNQNGYGSRPWQTLTGVVIFFIALVIVYAGWHLKTNGSKQARLSDEDKTVVTLLLNNQQVTDSVKVEKAISYMTKILQPVDDNVKAAFEKEYGRYKAADLLTALPSVSMDSKSYFWLNSDMKYVEVIFWSIFGVLASLLYFASESMRKGTFRKEELPVYWAKVFYAPLIAIIIVFSYKLITGTGNAVFDYTSVEIIVFSFVLGFFSGRAIELLNKIKDVILPGGKAEEPAVETGILAGKISVPDGVKGLTAERTKVSLKSSINGSAPVETETNPDGVYLFKDIREGIYDISAEKFLNGTKYSAAIFNEKLSKEKLAVLENLTLMEEKKEKQPA